MRALTNNTGTVVQTYETDEFGIPTRTQGSRTQPFGYTGEQRDTESGFVYLRARMYDPQLGRFLQRYPFAGFTASPLSLNRYSYVENNPVNLTDPSGENPLMAACAGGALFNVAIDVGSAWFGGEKLTGSQVLRSAGTGCVSGLAGFGVGKVVGSVAGRLAPGLTSFLADEVGSLTIMPVAGRITGYTRHGLNQAISRDGVGVAPRAILDAVSNPMRVTPQSGARMMYVGKDATVILNSQGQVVTTWARNQAGWRRVPGS